MDKYDNLLNEIIEKTKDGTMVWEIENPSSYESIVFQSGFAASAYSSSLSKNKKNLRFYSLKNTCHNWGAIGMK